jgi:hypothetical protein
MAEESKPNKRLFIIIAVVGILLDLTVIVLLASERITIAVAMPLLIVGMLVTFAPIVMSNVKSKR